MKTMVSEPKRLLLSPGDAYLIHHCTAIASEANMSDTVAQMVQFDVNHVDSQHLVSEVNVSDSAFVGFYGLKDLIHSADNPTNMA